jgi:hypothetical protein
MCWGATPSFRASWTATVTPLSHASSRKIGVLGQQQQALQGEHLDVALRLGQRLDGVYRLGGEDQAKRLSESRIRAAETRKRCSEAAAAAGGAQGGGGAD